VLALATAVRTHAHRFIAPHAELRRPGRSPRPGQRVRLQVGEALHRFEHALLVAEKLGASGKVVSAFDIARAMALGADWCNAARGFMFAPGCIASQSGHTDRCPTGVATQDPLLQRALAVADKIDRVASFHASTMHSLIELTAAAGLDHPSELKPHHFSRRVSASEVMTFAQLYPPLSPGELLDGTRDPRFSEGWRKASARDSCPLAA
jgi:hypothetical protein